MYSARVPSGFGLADCTPRSVDMERLLTMFWVPLGFQKCSALMPRSGPACYLLRRTIYNNIMELDRLNTSHQIATNIAGKHTFNQRVDGSNPSGLTNKNKDLVAKFRVERGFGVTSRVTSGQKSLSRKTHLKTSTQRASIPQPMPIMAASKRASARSQRMSPGFRSAISGLGSPPSAR